MPNDEWSPAGGKLNDEWLTLRLDEWTTQRCPSFLLQKPNRAGILNEDVGPLEPGTLPPRLPCDEFCMKLPLLVLFLCLLIAVPIRGQGQDVVPSRGQTEFFESRIRPILAEHCHSCHGPKKQMAGLRLDSRKTVLEGADSGPVVDLKNPEASRLLRAVRHSGKIKMPPKGKLAPQAVDALSAWIKMGASWPESASIAKSVPSAAASQKHWAFQPVQRPALPNVTNADWTCTQVDRFILAKLEAKGLKPSEPADRRTLIRRVTFDLIGLPPTLEEVDAFEADRSRDAFAKVVDRLLASPHYGERWGRHWLDVARYADTKGYVFFEEPNFPWAYTYRDYVIRAFNDDLPYDRFLVEQLAADKVVGRDSNPAGRSGILPHDKSALTALGFLTLGGRFMNNIHDIIDDRIDVVTRGLMGLTVTCARCHDHKYDPIPSKDYYSLYGVFASCAEPTVPPLFLPPAKTEQYLKFDKELKAREQKLMDFVRAKHAELVKGAKTRTAEYLMAAHALRDQPSTEEFMLLADGSDLNPTMIVRWKAYLDRTAQGDHPVFGLWHTLAAIPEEDFERQAAAVCAKLAGPADSARPINARIAEAFTAKPPTSMTELAKRYAELLNSVEWRWQFHLAIARRCGMKPNPLPASEEELRQVFYGDGAPPDVAMLPYGDLSLLPDRPSQATLQKLRKELETWRSTGPGAPPRAQVLEDLPTPFQSYVFVRGNPNNKGETVPRRFPEVLTGAKRKPFTQGSGRLELAQAIVDRDNPLTARVLVNRVWLHHVGAGLVRTPSDFGLRSEPPSHPELLDFLARWFIDNDWSIKKLHRLILLSAAYQQKSDDRPECAAVDPENRLIWKMNRRRLDFESLRDSLLAVSGQLDRTIGGPSVQNIFAPGSRRRTLYGHLDRLNVPGLYRTFDFPTPDATSPQRDTTTVPPQALLLMNSPFVQECARKATERPELTKETGAGKKVETFYRVFFGRPPTNEEQILAQEFLGMAPTPVTWQRYAQALLLGNEFAFLD
jgi:hypothetical protein